jgi:hypothetical protein
MPYQNRVNTIILPVFSAAGNQEDAAIYAAAEYALFDCFGNPTVKSLVNGGLTVQLDATTSQNVFVCVLGVADSNYCGSVEQGFKVALTGEEWLPVQLSSSKINFIKTGF